MFETKQITLLRKKQTPYFVIYLGSARVRGYFLSDLMNLNSTKCVSWEQMIINNSCVFAYSINNKAQLWNLNG